MGKGYLLPVLVFRHQFQRLGQEFHPGKCSGLLAVIDEPFVTILQHLDIGFRNGNGVLTLPCKASLTSLASKSVLFSTSTSKAFWMESNNCSMSLLVSTASLLLPSNRLARGFQSDGVQDNLQENCAIVLFTVMRPMMGVFPFLSIPLFFR